MRYAVRWMKRLGVLLIVLGGASIGGSLYIQHQVEEGSEKIKKAEQTVDRGRSFLSLNPATDEIGKGLARSADKKIQMGKEQIAHYTQMASRLKIGGIVLVVLGAALLWIRPHKRR